MAIRALALELLPRRPPSSRRPSAFYFDRSMLNLLFPFYESKEYLKGFLKRILDARVAIYIIQQLNSKKVRTVLEIH